MNTFSYRTPPVAASVLLLRVKKLKLDFHVNFVASSDPTLVSKYLLDLNKFLLTKTTLMSER